MIRILLLMAMVSSAACAAADALSQLGLRATTGAAPGFLPDAACARCHQAIAASYAEVGMARAFSRPAHSDTLKDSRVLQYAHPLTGQIYRLHRRGAELWFTQSQPATASEAAHELNLRVDWVLGSGHRAQSFVHQTEAGELYQLPVTWYAEKHGLAMSPGYEGRDHPGVERRLRRECMFCHNAYPEVAAGSDQPGQPDIYPQQLPEGIGCQRCHGPGAAHVRAVLDGRGLDAIHAAITNPARLAWPRRNDVCFQCHLLPAVEAIGTRRVGRGDYSFRPGERLSDYLIHAEIDDRAIARDDRFQINHHGYRLLQSRCFIQSRGEMGCVTCHDPHVRRVGAKAVGWYRDKCLGCHSTLGRDHGRDAPLAQGAADDRDCVRCHMPRRRTQDVVEATVTDHRIARGPFDSDILLAALKPQRPQIENLQLFDATLAMPATEETAYRALMALNNGGGVAAMQALTEAVKSFAPEQPSWWLQLARYQVAHRQYQDAAQSLQRMSPALQRAAAVRELQAMIAIGGDGLQRGAKLLRARSRTDDFHPEADYNLGIVERRLDRQKTAVAAFQRSVAARPLSAASWYQLARSLWAQRDATAAVQALQRAQAIKPDLAEAQALREEIEAGTRVR
jgi:hypothetical protein